MVLIFSEVYLICLIGNEICVEFCTSMILLYVNLLSHLKLDSVGNKNHENICLRPAWLVTQIKKLLQQPPSSKILAETDHGP